MIDYQQELEQAWNKVVEAAYPLPELKSVTDDNFDKFQETADYFTQYRKHKVFQNFRSDLKAGYHGMSLVGDALQQLKGLVFEFSRFLFRIKFVICDFMIIISNDVNIFNFQLDAKYSQVFKEGIETRPGLGRGHFLWRSRVFSIILLLRKWSLS